MKSSRNPEPNRKLFTHGSQTSNGSLSSAEDVFKLPSWITGDSISFHLKVRRPTKAAKETDFI